MHIILYKTNAVHSHELTIFGGYILAIQSFHAKFNLLFHASHVSKFKFLEILKQCQIILIHVQQLRHIIIHILYCLRFDP